jgi:hypothetical protein
MAAGIAAVRAPALDERPLNPAFIFNSAWKAQIEIVRQTRVERLASKEIVMIKKYLAMGLGALIAVAPVAAMAKTSTKTHTASHKTHKTHMASKSHHTAKKATAPEAPKS